MVSLNDHLLSRLVRPLFGFIVVLSIAAIGAATVYLALFASQVLGPWTAFMSASSGPIMAVIAVFGVYVNGRTAEKHLAAGKPRATILDAIKKKG